MSNIPEFSVSQIARSIKMLVEDSFGYVKIKGEISGFKKAASGHLYFNLKDDDAVINAVCFRNSASSVDFEIEDGLMVDTYGKVTTYAGRSCYQIIVEKIELAGAGAIMQMLEKRKIKLTKEGLFEQVHKKDLPFFPTRIGVISSKTGAVIQDIIKRVEARCSTHILLYSSVVQGKNASTEVINGLNYFAKLPKSQQPQLIIIARGGGSVEDLLPFSEEELVRKVFEYEIPIISAIGHETDFCLLDFVADVRASTPTAAAELSTIVFSEVSQDLDELVMRFIEAKDRFYQKKCDDFRYLSKLVKSPQEIVEKIEERFKIFTRSIKSSVKNILLLKSSKLDSISLGADEIRQKTMNKSQKIDSLADLIKIKVTSFFDSSDKALRSLERLLNSRSHNEVLKRGFCMIQDKEGELISNIGDLEGGQNVDIVGIGGAASVEIKKINLKK